MVADSGAKAGPGALRPLGLPKPIEVKADSDNCPVAVAVGVRDDPNAIRLLATDWRFLSPPRERTLTLPSPIKGEETRTSVIQPVIKVLSDSIGDDPDYGAWLKVQVLDRWRIDDEWWRESPISRAYFEVVSEGLKLTLFQDLLTGQWYRG